MRPPEFTGGTPDSRRADIAGAVETSKRPPEFTGGNPNITVQTFLHRAMLQRGRRNSPGGNAAGVCIGPYAVAPASMRPPEFTGGNKVQIGLFGEMRPLLQ